METPRLSNFVRSKRDIPLLFQHKFRFDELWFATWCLHIYRIVSDKVDDRSCAYEFADSGLKCRKHKTAMCTIIDIIKTVNPNNISYKSKEKVMTHKIRKVKTFSKSKTILILRQQYLVYWNRFQHTHWKGKDCYWQVLEDVKIWPLR